MHTDPETIGKFWFLLYVAAGIPVAWLHLRQQKMTDSYSKIPHSQSKSVVLFTLAVMWPLLLLSMALTYLQEKPHRPKNGRREATKSHSESSPGERREPALKQAQLPKEP